jgi:hypothetical protein
MGFRMNICKKAFLHQFRKKQIVNKLAADVTELREVPERFVMVVDLMINVYQVMAVMNKKSKSLHNPLSDLQYIHLAVTLITQLVLSHVDQCTEKLITIKGNLREGCGLDHLGIYLVFDGASPPAKLKTQKRRIKNRATDGEDRRLLSMMTQFQEEIHTHFWNAMQKRFADKYQLDRLIVNGTAIDGEGEWKCFRLAKYILGKMAQRQSTVIILTRDTDTFMYGLTVPFEFHQRLFIWYLYPKICGETYTQPGDNNFFFSIQDLVNVIAGNDPTIKWNSREDWSVISKRLIIAFISICGDDYVDSLIRSCPKEPLTVISDIWHWAAETSDPLGCLMVTLSKNKTLRRRYSNNSGRYAPLRMCDFITWQMYIGEIHKFIDNAWSGTDDIPYQLEYPPDDAMEGISRVLNNLTCEQVVSNQYMYKTLLNVAC